MTLQDFINKYKGKKIDWDGQFGAQCVDLYRFYVKEVWGKSQTPGVGGASQIFDSLKPADFYKERNTPAGIPKPGDVITWDENYTKHGHVGVVVSADVKSITVFEQNNPLGGPCQIGTHSYNHIIGWFRPLTQTPMNYVQKILVLFSQVEDQATALLAIQNWIDFLKADERMNGYTLEITHADTNEVFYTKSSPTSDGNPIYADPDQIAAEGDRLEKELGKEFDAVCLIYNDKFVIGDPPNHPVDNPLYVHGFNVFSIPLSWISNLNSGVLPVVVAKEACELFFAHENSHADYFIINAETGAGLHDKTHDVMPHDSTRPSNLWDYRDYLVELKPYWPTLCNIGEPVPQGDPMLVYKFDNSPTEYILTDDATLIGVTAAGLTKTLKGRPQKLVVLPASQKANFVIADSAVN